MSVPPLKKSAPVKVAKPAVVKSANVPSAAPVKATAPHEGKIETMTDTAKITDAVKKTASDTGAQAQAVFSDISERAKAAVEKSQKLAEELTEFSKGNVEAIVASGKLAAKGVEAMGQDAAEFGRKNLESAQAALKSFAAVKSPAEFFKLQSDYAKSAFDTLVAHTSKNTEASLKLAGDVFQPLSNRMAQGTE